MSALVTLALATPSLAPVTLGQALDSVGAFEIASAGAQSTRDPSEDPSGLARRALAPPPPRHGARALFALGGALVVAGLFGTVASPGCKTRDANEACIDARGTDPLFPALIAAGLGAAIAGSWWWHHVLPPEPDAPDP